MKAIMTPKDYDACYKKSAEIGLFKKGEDCQGEFDHPGRVYRKCLRCSHISKDILKKELFERIK